MKKPPSAKKPALIQLLESLPLHDRQSLLDTLLQYPEMTNMVTKSFKLKMAKANPTEIQKFEQACLQKIAQLYGG